MKNKVWLEELVYIRAFAILAVILIHVTMYSVARKIDSPLYFINYFINDLAHFAVPIFILVSGISLTIAYSHKKLNLKEFFMKRISTLIPAYLFITFVYLYLFASDSFTLQEYLDRLLHGSGTTHLYFVPLIIKLYLVFPILLWAGKKLTHRMSNTKLLFALLLLLHFLFYYRIPILIGLNLDFLQEYHLSYTLFFGRDFSYFWGYLGYFIFGIIVALKIDELKSYIVNLNFKRLIMIFPLFSIIGTFAYFNAIAEHGSYSEASLSVKNIVQMIAILFNYYSFIFLFKVSNIVSKKENSFVSFIRDIGNHSFAIYLLHMIFIYYLIRILPSGRITYTDVSFYTILFVFSLFGSLSVSYAVNALPIPKTIKRTLVGNDVKV